MNSRMTHAAIDPLEMPDQPDGRAIPDNRVVLRPGGRNGRCRPSRMTVPDLVVIWGAGGDLVSFTHACVTLARIDPFTVSETSQNPNHFRERVRTNRATDPSIYFQVFGEFSGGGADNSLAFTQSPTHSDGRSPEPPSEGDDKFSKS